MGETYIKTSMPSFNVRDFFVAALPIIAVFGAGRLFPMPRETRETRAPFQPPSWVFGPMWTYLTLALGFITACILRSINGTRPLVRRCQPYILAFYFLLVAGLIGWLILYHYQRTTESFWLLVVTTYLAIGYIVYLARCRAKTIWIAALMPLPFWLVLATALNGHQL